MSRLSAICRCCLGNGIPRRSFTVALIVGTLLNLINQGDALFGGRSLNLTKIVLTYMVPYCVATYGAASYQWAARRAAQSGWVPSDADDTLRHAEVDAADRHRGSGG